MSVLIKVLCSPWWPNRERIFGVWLMKDMTTCCFGLERCCHGEKQLLQQKNPSAGFPQITQIQIMLAAYQAISNAWMDWGFWKGKKPSPDYPINFLMNSVSRVCPFCAISEPCVSSWLCVGYKMKKRVGAIEEFEFLPLTEGKQLHITIAITGWLCTGKYSKNMMRKQRGPQRAVAVSCFRLCLCSQSTMSAPHFHGMVAKPRQFSP